MDDLLTRRVKIGVQYIGTKYCGWQSQKNAVSVQELVEKALGGVLGHEVRLTASGRTDEGVHARRQVAHFDTDVEIKPFNLILGANVRLPDDIAVVDAEYTDNSFDARRDAKRKTYVYRMYVDSVRRPFLDVNHLQIYKQPDLSAMNRAAGGEYYRNIGLRQRFFIQHGAHCCGYSFVGGARKNKGGGLAANHRFKRQVTVRKDSSAARFDA